MIICKFLVLNVVLESGKLITLKSGYEVSEKRDQEEGSSIFSQKSCDPVILQVAYIKEALKLSYIFRLCLHV